MIALAFLRCRSRTLFGSSSDEAPRSRNLELTRFAGEVNNAHVQGLKHIVASHSLGKPRPYEYQVDALCRSRQKRCTVMVIGWGCCSTRPTDCRTEGRIRREEP